ncbi:hypothetical protein BDV33DRAFT_186625 [Aspergillus novoparasiticus]|uniref:Thioester reductase (TE) domain-containing protein n=1 Tax=Aspergillus novoparasiticus TaxID=986946 RepID=A0A5N6FA82_9EURO|nr:hypothetical protein BDV33DRAFT_186625 [Aspergillus novoparasiticus]
MWEFYSGKVILITGGSRFLGTTLVYRIKRRQWLPEEYANKMSDPTLITVINADIMKTDLSIDAEIVGSLSSSINILQSLPRISEVIVGATERVARMFLGFDNLERFVYLSTAYANSHIWQEEIATTTRGEWAQVHSSGSSQEFQRHDFPWPYAYAKHLSERVMHCMFSDQGFNLPMSILCTAFMATTALSTSVWARIATWSSNPENDTTIDEVPVDVVVDRLLLHTVKRTSGPVHAVSGELARSTVGEIWRNAMRFRRIMWEPRLIWTNSDWHSPDLHLVARLEGCHNLTLRRHQIR